MTEGKNEDRYPLTKIGGVRLQKRRAKAVVLPPSDTGLDRDLLRVAMRAGRPDAKRRRECADIGEPRESMAELAARVCAARRPPRAPDAAVSAAPVAAEPEFPAIAFAGAGSRAEATKDAEVFQTMAESLREEVARRGDAGGEEMYEIGRIEMGKSRLLIGDGGGVLAIAGKKEDEEERRAEGGSKPAPVPLAITLPRVTGGRNATVSDASVTIGDSADIEEVTLASGSVGGRSTALVPVHQSSRGLITVARPGTGSAAAAAAVAAPQTIGRALVRVERGKDGRSRAVVYGSARDVAESIAVPYVGEHACDTRCKFAALADVATADSCAAFEEKMREQGILSTGGKDNPKVSDLWVCIASGNIHDCRDHTCDALLPREGFYICSKTGLSHGSVISGTDYYGADGIEHITGASARRMDDAVARQATLAYMRRPECGSSSESVAAAALAAASWTRAEAAAAGRLRAEETAGANVASGIREIAERKEEQGEAREDAVPVGYQPDGAHAERTERDREERKALERELVAWAADVARTLGSGEEYADGEWLGQTLDKWLAMAEGIVAPLVSADASGTFSRVRKSDGRDEAWCFDADHPSAKKAQASRRRRRGEIAAAATSSTTWGGPPAEGAGTRLASDSMAAASGSEAFRAGMTKRYSRLVVRMWVMVTLIQKTAADASAMRMEVFVKSGASAAPDAAGDAASANSAPLPPTTSSERRCFRQLWHQQDSTKSFGCVVPKSVDPEQQGRPRVRSKIKAVHMKTLALGILDAAASGYDAPADVTTLGLPDDVTARIEDAIHAAGGVGDTSFVVRDDYVRTKLAPSFDRHVTSSSRKSQAARTKQKGSGGGGSRAKAAGSEAFVIDSSKINEGTVFTRKCFSVVSEWSRIKLVHDICAAERDPREAVQDFRRRCDLFRLN